MKKLLFSILLSLIVDGLSSAYGQNQAGWNYQYADMQASSYYPYPTTVKTNNQLTLKFYSPDANITGAVGLLTGDFYGDGKLEWVATYNSTFSKAFNGAGSVLISTTSLPDNSIATLLADFNNDNIPDIGVGTGWVSTALLNINFYDSTGSIVKDFTKSSSGGGEFDVGITPVAVLPDGKLVVNNSAGYSLYPRGFSVFDTATEGEEWFYSVGPTPGFISVADVNNNGVYNFVASSFTPHNGDIGTGNNGVGTQTNDADMWCIVVDENGNEVFSQIYPNPSSGNANHYFVDFKNDSLYEILSAEEHDPTYYPGLSQLHVFNASNGSTLHSFPGANNMNWAVSTCDINNDGAKEIIASNYSQWNYSYQYILDSALNVIDSSSINGIVCATADLMGDGIPEIILYWQDTIKVLDNNLNQIAYYVCNGTINNVIVSDLDGDGINNILVAADNDGFYSLEFGLELAPPVASFQSGDSIICANDCINFTDHSTNATSWQWSFAGAADSTSTAQNPQNVCYLTAGAYNVTLIASNSIGSDSLTFTNYINVNPAPPPPTITQSHDTLYCSTDSSYISYQWYIDSNLIIGATDKYLVITHNGNYNLDVTNTNGCSIAAGININTGINEFSPNNYISLFPNPAISQLTIRTSSFHNEAVMVSVVNVLGQIVLPSHSLSFAPGSDETLDVSNLPAGIYFVEMKTESESVVKRFVKE